MWGSEDSTSTSDTESLENDDKSSFEVNNCGSSKSLCCKHQKKKSPVNRLFTNLQSLVLLLLGNLHENQNMRDPSQQPQILLGKQHGAKALWGSLDSRQNGHSVLLN